MSLDRGDRFGNLQIDDFLTVQVQMTCYGKRGVLVGAEAIVQRTPGSQIADVDGLQAIAAEEGCIADTA